MTGYIYAIGSENGAVKIGYSVDPKSRLPFLRTGHPGKLTLLGAVDAVRSQEAEIHKLLSRWHVSGEWFRLEGAVIAFVEMLSKSPKPRKSPEPKMEGDMKNELDWEAVKLAGHKLGIKPRTVQSWRERQAVPFKWWLPIMDKAGGKITIEALQRSRE